jgi:hypothetical protein
MVRQASTKPRSDADKVTELLAEEARYCRELADEYEDGGFDAGATTASPTRTRDGARRWPKKVFQNGGLWVGVLNLWGVSPRIGGGGGALKVRDH